MGDDSRDGAVTHPLDAEQNRNSKKTQDDKRESVLRCMEKREGQGGKEQPKARLNRAAEEKFLADTCRNAKEEGTDWILHLSRKLSRDILHLIVEVRLKLGRERAAHGTENEAN